MASFFFLTISSHGGFTALRWEVYVGRTKRLSLTQIAHSLNIRKTASVLKDILFWGGKKKSPFPLKQLEGSSRLFRVFSEEQLGNYCSKCAQEGSNEDLKEKRQRLIKPL